MARKIPFDGTPPPVKPGDPIQICTALGAWVDVEAVTEPRYDRDAALGRRCYLTVSVTSPELLAIYGHPVNWPADAVRPRPEPEVGRE